VFLANLARSGKICNARLFEGCAERPQRPSQPRKLLEAVLLSRVTNLWHSHCKPKHNWDFRAQFENETPPGHVFRARQRLISRLVGQPPTCTGLGLSRPGSMVGRT
jgi:hypothetical protein